MIIINEILIFYKSDEIINLAVTILFIIQAALVIPNYVPPLTKKGPVIAKSAIPKIMVSLALINFFAAYYVTKVDYIPNSAKYGHLIMGIFPFFPTYFILAGKIEIID